MTDHLKPVYRKWVIVVSIVSAMIVMPAGSLRAIEGVGTFSVGIKFWGALWDSPYTRIIAREIERAENIINLSNFSPLADNTVWRYRTTYKTGIGYLAGPLVSYQIPNKKVTFSAAVMWLNYFTASYREQAVIDTRLAYARYFFPLKMNTNIKLKRNEIDSAVSFAVHDYVKLYVGYKYQDSSARNIVNLIAAYYTSRYDITVHLPTAGIALSYPATDRLVLSLQLGALYSFPSIKEPYFRTVDKIYSQPGFNSEAAMTIMPVEHFVIQLGYRAQLYGFSMLKKNTSLIMFSLQQYNYARDLLPVGLLYRTRYRELDIFHGFTVACMAYF